jgi:F420-0:gamma-glutamyl ligase
VAVVVVDEKRGRRLRVGLTKTAEGWIKVVELKRAHEEGELDERKRG